MLNLVRMAMTRSVTWLRHAHAFLLGLRDDSRKTFVAYQRAALLVGPPRAACFGGTGRANECGEGTRRGMALRDEDPLGW